MLRKRVDLTDPTVRSCASTGGLVQGYNAQATVGEGQIVIAARIAPSAADQTQLGPMIDAATHELEAAGIADPQDRAEWERGRPPRLPHPDTPHPQAARVHRDPRHGATRQALHAT